MDLMTYRVSHLQCEGESTIDPELVWHETQAAIYEALSCRVQETQTQALDLYQLGVVVLGVVAFGVVVSPEPAALLFRLSFFSFFSFTPGVVGLFSPPLVDFLAGASRSSVFREGGEPSLATAGSVAVVEIFSDWEDLFVDMEDVRVESCDLVSRKDPGSPTMGFSSMYSLA